MSLAQNAIYLAWADTKARYKKSVLGPFWPTLTNLLGVVGLSLVWGSLMNQDMHTFVPQLAIGLVTWQLISGVLMDGPTCFARQAAMIRNVAVPAWFFASRLLARHLINFLHNAAILIGVMLYYEVPVTIETWLFVPGLLMVALNLYWILHMLGLAGARFRDIEHLVSGIVPMLFFISPVIYRADRLPPGLNLVWLNPFSYMIEAMRAPLLGYSVHPDTWIILLGMLFVGGGFTWLYQIRQGRNLAFWV
jgi:ABC-type polysaccharide/polyol phosphate export permease